MKNSSLKGKFHKFRFKQVTRSNIGISNLEIRNEYHELRSCTHIGFEEWMKNHCQDGLLKFLIIIMSKATFSKTVFLYLWLLLTRSMNSLLFCDKMKDFNL